MNLLQRLCPHWFGWSYNTHRRRRWCRLCAQQQRRLVLDTGYASETEPMGRTVRETNTWLDDVEGAFHVELFLDGELLEVERISTDGDL